MPWFIEKKGILWVSELPQNATNMSKCSIITQNGAKYHAYLYGIYFFSGELDILGFSNCKFWFGQTGYHPLYEVVKKEALNMNLEPFSGSRMVKEFVDKLKINDWDPEIFSDLCASALKSKDQDLVKFCDNLSTKEWQILLDFCNNKANPNVWKFKNDK